jgi:ubiquinone/menaquinone biosynthesis C-methylase UbiE
MIKRARETGQGAGVADRLEFRVADVQDLPFEDNVFDAVLCIRTVGDAVPESAAPSV